MVNAQVGFGDISDQFSALPTSFNISHLSAIGNGSGSARNLVLGLDWRQKLGEVVTFEVPREGIFHHFFEEWFFSESLDCQLHASRFELNILIGLSTGCSEPRCGSFFCSLALHSQFFGVRCIFLAERKLMKEWWWLPGSLSTTADTHNGLLRAAVGRKGPWAGFYASAITDKAQICRLGQRNPTAIILPGADKKAFWIRRQHARPP